MATNKNETPAIELDEVTKAAVEALVKSRVEEALKAKEAETKKEIIPEAKPGYDPRMEERVCVRLLYDGDKYKEPVFLQINGENCLVQRGVPVMIKRKFAILLEQSDDASKKAIRYEQKQSKELDAIKSYGI